MPDRLTLPVLLGPTGSGKTELIHKLESDRFEIISVDSRQVYKELHIGAATPDPDTLQKIPHHLINLLRPDQCMDAAFFVRECLRIIPEVLRRGRIPFLVGGTGFYYRALNSGGLFETEIDSKLRTEIQLKTAKERLQDLRELDPGVLIEAHEKASAGRIHPNDDYRVGRALEIMRSTGKSIREFWNGREMGQQKAAYRFQGWWLEIPRELYWQRLQIRAASMVQEGMVVEAAQVYQKYGDCPGLTGLGYPEALQVWRGMKSEAELCEALFIAHRQYGKRQRTWFRREDSLSSIAPENFSVEIEKARSWLTIG